MREYLTRKEFDEKLADWAKNHKSRTCQRLLDQCKGGFDGFPPHLKEEVYRNLGVNPEVVYFKVN